MAEAPAAAPAAPVPPAGGEIARRLATPDPSLLRARLKKELKQWEARFRTAHGRDATPQDIVKIPEVARKYKLYEKYKKLDMRMSGPKARRPEAPSSGQADAHRDLVGAPQRERMTPKKRRTTEPDEIGPSPARPGGGLFGAPTPCKTSRTAGTPRSVGFCSFSAGQPFSSPTGVRSFPPTTPSRCGGRRPSVTTDLCQASPVKSRGQSANPFLVREREGAPRTPGRSGPGSFKYPSPKRSGVETPRRTPCRTRRTFAMLFGMDEEEVNNLGFSISTAKCYGSFPVQPGLPLQSKGHSERNGHEDEEDIVVPANFHVIAASRTSSKPPPENEPDDVEEDEDEDEDDQEGEQEDDGEDQVWPEDEPDGD